MILKNIDVLKEIIKLGKEITLLRETKDNEKINKENLYKSRKKQEDLAKYLDNQEIEELEDGKILFKAIGKNNPELKSWILNMQDNVKIIKPQTLKNEVKEILNKMLLNI